MDDTEVKQPEVVANDDGGAIAKLGELVAAHRECVSPEAMLALLEKTVDECTSGDFKTASDARERLPVIVIAASALVR